MQIADLRAAMHAEDLETAIAAIRAACGGRRADVLPDLLALLAADEVGYFVEECLPSFGPTAMRPLRELLHDPAAPDRARWRAAGVLALLGDREAAPILLEAIGDPAVNQGYLGRLAQLAPERLAERVRAVLHERVEQLLATTDPGLAAYFAHLIRVLAEPAIPRNRRDEQLLVQVATRSRDWRVREAAAMVLVMVLVRQFSGQTVPGELLNVAGPVTLPVVERVLAPYPLPANRGRLDVLIEGDTGRWAVEVKAAGDLRAEVLEQVLADSRAASATAWLIVLTAVSNRFRRLARQRHVLLTGPAELSTLSQLLAA